MQYGRLKRGIASILAAACLSVSFGFVAYGAENEITLGMFPREHAKAMYAAYKPLAKHLEEKLGKKVTLVFAKDFDAFKRMLASGDFDIVHLNHFQYINVRKNPGYEAVVMNQEAGSEKLKGAFYVRADSNISKLTDLKGKTIIFGGNKDAFISYMVAAKMLHDAGLGPNDYNPQFAINPPNAIIALSRGEGDVAVAGEAVLSRPIVKNAGADKNVRQIAASEAYPGLPWAVKKSLGPKFKNKVKQAFLSVNTTPEGKEILKAASVDGFANVEDSDYDSAVKVIQFVKGMK